MKPALSRDSILEAGLALLDEAGPEALSMRALARRLGVTATAIYYHYDGRDELVEGIVDHICGRVLDPVPVDGAWDDRLRALMDRMADEASAHPAVVTWIITTSARRGPVLRIHELILTICREAGFAPDVAMAIKGSLLRHVVGHLTLRTAAPGPHWRQLPKGDFPEHWAAGAAIDCFDPEANFRAGVDALLAAFTPESG